MSLISLYSDTFVVTLQGVAALFQSDQIQSSSSTYVENGTQLTFTFTTAPLPDTDQMSECAMIETTTYMTLVAGNPVTVYALDQSATILDTVMFASTGTVTVWGAFLWGGALWGGSVGRTPAFTRSRSLGTTRSSSSAAAICYG